MNKPSSCPICGDQIQEPSKEGISWKIDCLRCGHFLIESHVRPPSEYFDLTQKANLSGWVRENQGFTLSVESTKKFLDLQTPTVGEKGEKILKLFATKTPKPGGEINIFSDKGEGYIHKSKILGTQFSLRQEDLNTIGPNIIQLQLLAHSWSVDCSELFYLLKNYLIAEIKALEHLPNGNLRITPQGWAYLDSLRKGNLGSQVGFIAMWFDNSMQFARVAIENGIRTAGYKPFRVDQKEHNNDITDEIIVGIRGSKFLVADLTKHRNGVYYEAGFAKGLGLEVIWLCRKDEEKDRHFDIRQLNTIFWEEDKLAELSKALENRIVATISRGPLAGTN